MWKATYAADSRLFPAYAGVSLWKTRNTTPHMTFPRVCGGVSITKVKRVSKMLTCRWCGEIFRNYEQMDRTTDGFWCELCDSFSYYNPGEYDHRRLLLLLEDKQSRDVHSPSPALPRLRKRLSPLRYPGGKSKLIDYLYSRLCQDQLDTFVEVFAGGASLGLSLLDAGKINRLILNDKDPGVYVFWHTVLNCPQELIFRLQSGFPTHRDLAAAKAHLSSSDAPTPSLAWSFLLANRLSYSGIISANPQGGKNGPQEALLARWNPKALEQRIQHIHSMRDRIVLYNENYEEFISDRAWWSSGGRTLFVDPPYWFLLQGPKLYETSFSEADHENLAWLLQDLYREYPDADVIITYDNHPRVRELYPLATQEVIARRYSI